MNIYDKIKKLIALSGSANKHEASSAARKACDLIRKHKLTVENNQSRKALLRIVHLYHPQKCAYCHRISTRFESCIFDEFTKEIFHLGCFLTSLRDLDKDYDLNEDFIPTHED